MVAVLGLAVAVAPAGAQQGGTPKIVYVNTQALLAVAPGRTAAESTYNKDYAAWTDELNKMGQDIQTMIADYQKAEPTLTDAAKQMRQKSIQTKQQAYADRQSQLQQQAQDRQNELMAPVMETVKETLEKIRMENGYALILDSQAVVASDKNLDITDNVVARLKISAAAKKDSDTKPAPKKAGGG
jgi:outer membrane protein